MRCMQAAQVNKHTRLIIITKTNVFVERVGRSTLCIQQIKSRECAAMSPIFKKNNIRDQIEKMSAVSPFLVNEFNLILMLPACMR